jgi:hypothetical protein
MMAPLAVTPGSVWSLQGFDGTVVILAGPFGTLHGSREYIVAPLYAASKEVPWTSEDFRLAASEMPDGRQHYAALWNARPILEQRLQLQLGNVPDDGTVALRDAYFASINELPTSKNPRLGRPIRSAKDTAAQFQLRELARWEPLSAEVTRELAKADAAPDLDSTVEASATFSLSNAQELAAFNETELADCIRTAERMIANLAITIDGANAASLALPMAGPGAYQINAELAEAVEAIMHKRGTIVADSPASQSVPEASANSELAMAA